MVTPQFLPIPKAIHALACETISRRVDRLPFTRNDVEITEGIVGITLECLNAEVMRTLPLKTVARGTGTTPASPNASVSAGEATRVGSHRLLPRSW